MRGLLDVHHMVCSLCRNRRYCGATCQLRHWESATDPHKLLCARRRESTGAGGLRTAWNRRRARTKSPRRLRRVVLFMGSDSMARWAQSNANCPSGPEVCMHLAYKGGFDALRRAHELGWPWNEWTCRDSHTKGASTC